MLKATAARRIASVVIHHATQRCVKDPSGVTAIAYGLIAALIAVGIITAARPLGTQISATFTTVTSAMQNA
jgi:pilus assembly protein Flp/PilA